MIQDAIYGLLSTLCCAQACSAQARPTVSLDGRWLLTVPGKGAYKIEVPGSWQARIPELRDYVGRASYTRDISIPESWKGRRIFLCFGAVDYYADVCVNDHEVGSHEGGYTPFEFDVTEHIRFGQSNSIRVEVADAGPGRPVDGIKFEEIPRGKQSWYGNASGIWQSARLEARPAGHIQRIVADPDIDRSTATVRVELAGPVKGKLRVSIDAPEGAKAAAGVTLDVNPGQERVEYEVELAEAKLWSPECPALYGVRVELVDGGDVVDSLETRFGMRKIEARDGKILLNNKPIFIAGALDQDFYPITEYTTPSADYLRDQFLKAKRLGLNLLRCHIKVPDPRYLDCADELGLMVWYEIPNWIDLTEDAKRRARETLTDMLRRDHNHPSLVIVSIINEAWGVNVQDESHRKWMAEMYDYAKTLEPYRLIVDNSACGGNFHVKTDIEDFHAYFQIPDQAAQYDEWIEDFSKHPQWTFGGGAKRRGFEPLVLSEFGNWGLPRLSNLAKVYGGEDPWWFGNRRSPSSQATSPAGVQDRFVEYHLDKAFGTIDEMADAFQDQEWLALKYQIEQLRKRHSIVGYVITEFTDLHWESNGLLDWCRNPKTFYELMHTVQNQDVVLAQPSRSNFASGEDAELRFWVSHFSQVDLYASKVLYRCEGLVDRGEIMLDNIEPGSAREVGRITISAPRVEIPTKMRLQIQLVDRNGRTIASNYADFNVFPESRPTVPRDVIVAKKLDPSMARRILDGASALICTESAEDSPFGKDGLRVVDRNESGRWGAWCNSVIWFRRSAAFGQAPLPKTMDLSFKNMIPNCVIDGVDPKHWESDVLSAIFVGWLHAHAAVIVQAKCGSGKAVLTTLPLLSAADSDPMARYLLGSLAGYAASDECRPVLECTLEGR